MSRVLLVQPSGNTLFSHAKRKQWGLAILAWEGNGKRRYQFQDGQLRTISDGYYSLMEEVERPADSAARIISSLKAMVRGAGAGGKSTIPAAPERIFSVDSQVAAWKAEWAKAFRDPKYLAKVRGDGKSGKRKRERNYTLALATEAFSPGALAAKDWKSARAALMTVLGATDLVPAKEVASLGRRRPNAEAGEALARALFQILHGRESFTDALGRWLDAVAAVNGEGTSWQLATAPLALVHPDEHIVVRPVSFRKQARAMGLTFPATPSVEGYVKMQAMANAINRHLVDAGLAPADLFDVYEFIVATA